MEDPLHHPPQTDSAWEVEEDHRVCRLNANIHRSTVVSVDDPRWPLDKLLLQFYLLRSRRLYPPWLPKKAVKVEDLDTRDVTQLTSERGLASSW
ncbi:MAG: hypothetical protein ACYCOU_11000 [Sulfobacillus sp.]